MIREALARLGRPAHDLEKVFGEGKSTTGDDGWRRIVWSQTWFGENVEARYTFDPSGSLIRIDYSTGDAAKTIASIREELGEPTKEGPAPHFLNSDAIAIWERDRLTITLEDYARGCEVGITANQET